MENTTKGELIKMSLGFKLTVSQKDHANKIIERLMKDKGFNKTQAFMHIMDKFENIEIGNTRNENIDPSIKDVLASVKCNMLGFNKDKGILVCRETMFKKKEVTELLGSYNIIKDNCLACLEEKRRIAQLELDKEMRKESVRKLQKFMKDFINISQSGFKYTANLCLCDADKGNLVFSRGGDSLQCPLLQGELVDIKMVCMEKINQKTQKKPCEFLASLEGIQNIDLSMLKNLEDILPNDSFVEPRQKELDKADEQRKRIEIDAEYKVLEGECNCPDDNEKNESCIDPKCPYIDKCDSYSPEKKWAPEKLK